MTKELHDLNNAERDNHEGRALVAIRKILESHERRIIEQRREIHELKNLVHRLMEKL